MESRTLLEILNDVNVSLDYATVNTIGETPESDQVVRLIRGEYSKLMDRDDWPHLNVTTTLDGLSDVTRPNFMKVPADVAQVDSIRYNNTETGDTNNKMKSITYYEDPNDFLDKIYSRNTGDSNVSVFNTAEGVPIWVITDQAPSFCTSFDDDIIIFDAYDSAEDTTLQSSKSLVMGLRGSAWTEDDSFTPFMPVGMFSMFISKCKIIANEQLRQVSLPTETRDHQVALNRQSRKKRVNNKITKPNYGRGK
jgi:hypothetical protein